MNYSKKQYIFIIISSHTDNFCVVEANNRFINGLYKGTPLYIEQIILFAFEYSIIVT